MSLNKPYTVVHRKITGKNIHQYEINIERVIKTINQNSRCPLLFDDVFVFVRFFNRNLNQWCPAHFSSAFNQNKTQSKRREKKKKILVLVNMHASFERGHITFRFYDQINGFHLELKNSIET